MDLPDWLKEDNPPASVTTQTAYSEGGSAPSSSLGSSSITVPDASPNNNINNNNYYEDEGNGKRQYVGFKRALFREWKILLLALAMIILMNVPFLRFVFYPLDIFATYIHEICHGMAALLLGGSISKLEIFADTSGLAYTVIPNLANRGFVISAGYQGTPVVGFLLLIFRRTKRGPRFGLLALAVWMIVSTALWIRNFFGVVAVSILSVLFLLAGWKLPSAWMRAFYTVLCVTVTLNAITHVVVLFGSSSYVNGEARPSDANAMAEAINGTTSLMWAFVWLCLALVMTLLGVVLAIPGPDEDPAFRCCGMCLDCGLFHVCNATRKKGDDVA